MHQLECKTQSHAVATLLTAGFVLAGRRYKHRATLSTSIYLSNFQPAKREAAAHSAAAPILLSLRCWWSFKQYVRSKSPPRNPFIPALNKRPYTQQQTIAGSSSTSKLSFLSPCSHPMPSLTLAATFWVWSSTREWFGKIFLGGLFVCFFVFSLFRKPDSGVRNLPSQLE